MAIKSCNGCVAPKRYPGCHGVCPEYIQEKAEYEAKKAEEAKARYIRNGLIQQQYNAVTRATKGKRKSNGGKDNGR